MRPGTGIRRVIVVVLDGVRPDAVELFDLVHLRRLMAGGASSLSATTVTPSVTTAAMTSLLTGVSPAAHGIMTDRVFIPKTAGGLRPLPSVLAGHGFPSVAYMADVPTILRGIAARVGRAFGFDTLRLAGKSAPEILLAARQTLRLQRRGLIVFHWPDADRAGHAHGWMSGAYAEACCRLDGTLGMLAALSDVPHDPHTLLIALADHGGGGVVSNDHEADHPLDRTIPLVLSGGAVNQMTLNRPRLIDVPPTVLHALGIDCPAIYEGRALLEAFAGIEAAAAVA
ncbi:MAG: sulfatase [Gemmatimonadetes bacterium]|nr:sulfatase [Gemmatimonadota bacterium]